jgi:hypothetical protein
MHSASAMLERVSVRGRRAFICCNRLVVQLRLSTVTCRRRPGSRQRGSKLSMPCRSPAQSLFTFCSYLQHPWANFFQLQLVWLRISRKPFKQQSIAWYVWALCSMCESSRPFILQTKLLKYFGSEASEFSDSEVLGIISHFLVQFTKVQSVCGKIAITKIFALFFR